MNMQEEYAAADKFLGNNRLALTTLEADMHAAVTAAIASVALRDDPGNAGWSQLASSAPAAQDSPEQIRTRRNNQDTVVMKVVSLSGRDTLDGIRRDISVVNRSRMELSLRFKEATRKLFLNNINVN